MDTERKEILQVTAVDLLFYRLRERFGGKSCRRRCELTNLDDSETLKWASDWLSVKERREKVHVLAKSMST
jgi:hypothetical protein